MKKKRDRRENMEDKIQKIEYGKRRDKYKRKEE